MLQNSNVEVTYQIKRYTPDIDAKTISLEIAVGSIIDGAFVSDGRGLIRHVIRNISNQDIEKTETLTVDIDGQVTLSLIPIDNNQIKIDDVPQDHTIGQLVSCAGKVENDTVTVAYYYTKLGRDWFNEAAMFVADSNPEYDGLNDYQYNSKRLWSILVEMGLVSGVVI